MGRSIFGWDLPPGCTMRDIERAAGGDMPPFCEDCDKGETCEQDMLVDELVTCEQLKKLRQEMKDQAKDEAEFFERDHKDRSGEGGESE